jgi:GAF domain-containing protein
MARAVDEPRPASRPKVPDLSEVVYSEALMVDLLRPIVDEVAATFPELAGASVSVAGEMGRLETVGASSQAVDDLDQLQYLHGGPCVEAVRTGSEVQVSIPDGRYPEFEEAVLAREIKLVHSVPLTAAGTSWGALNLYSREVSAPRPSESDGLRELAERAAVVLANAVSWSRLQSTNERLTRILESRGIIGQAQGILMAREGIGSDQAFDILRRASQRMNRKLRDIAAEVVGGVEARSVGRHDAVS